MVKKTRPKRQNPQPSEQRTTIVQTRPAAETYDVFYEVDQLRRKWLNIPHERLITSTIFISRSFPATKWLKVNNNPHHFIFNFQEISRAVGVTDQGFCYCICYCYAPLCRRIDSSPETSSTLSPRGLWKFQSLNRSDRSRSRSSIS